MADGSLHVVSRLGPFHSSIVQWFKEETLKGSCRGLTRNPKLSRPRAPGMSPGMTPYPGNERFPRGRQPLRTCRVP